MKNYFLQQYVASSSSIPGYFLFDAALMFLAYNQLVAAQRVTGDVLEIDPLRCSPMISVELAIVSELCGYGIKCGQVFDGVTTQADRKEKLRALIPKAPKDKQPALAGRFQVAYGEPLCP